MPLFALAAAEPANAESRLRKEAADKRAEGQRQAEKKRLTDIAVAKAAGNIVDPSAPTRNSWLLRTPSNQRKLLQAV